MSIIEQAAKRLEELSRAGVAVPWAAAGLAQSDVRTRIETNRRQANGVSTPVEAVRQMERESVVARNVQKAAPVVPPTDASVVAQAMAHAEVPIALPLAAPMAPAVAPAFGPSPARARPEIVTLDLNKLEQSGHLVPTQTRSVLAEELRHIKRPLLKIARNKEMEGSRRSLIMVTSALPREGKTFCSINLAMSIATEIDMSVLLIDADVVRPEVLNRLGISPRKGLLDLLMEPNLDVADLVLETNVPKLSILPAGTRNSLSTELLASEAMEDFLESLSTRYPAHIVVFDGPPLLVTNEASVLATRVGQVLLVVESSSTPRSAVEKAFAALEQCPIVMSMLNKAPQPKAPMGYGYYYG
jgi:protein-tyrosine kinase